VCREKQNCKIGKKLGEILNWVVSVFFFNESSMKPHLRSVNLERIVI